MPARIKKGDLVFILMGKDQGKKEKVLKVFPKENKVLVENVNVVQKHLRPTQKFQGGLVKRALPTYLSKVMLVCPSCNKPTRVRGTESADKKLKRICGRCGEVIS